MTSRRRAIVAAAGLAIPFLPPVFGAMPAGGFPKALVVCAASLMAPGAAGLLWPGGTGAPRRFVHALAAAVLLNVAAVLLLKVEGLSPTPRSFAATLGGLTVLTGALGAGQGGRLPGLRREAAAWMTALGAFGLAWLAGASVVPPLEDQDMEVQGTAWGLVHDLEPLCLTNRSTLYFFAHPPLLHALNASTITMAGELPTVRPAHAAAAAERAKLPPERRRRGVVAALGALRDPGPRTDRSFVWYHEVYKPFLESPALLGTRAPNWVLAAAVAVLLWVGSRRLGAGPADAALVTAAYVTLPEIFVRSGYGGYYALTAATLLAGASLAAGGAGGGRSGYAAGVFAALANQKALVLAAAVALARGLAAAGGRTRAALPPALPLLLGIVAGGAAFWIWGLALAPNEFVADHLLDHGVRRLAGGEALSRTGKVLYPSRPGVWLELARNVGWIWAALSVAGIASGLRLVKRSAFTAILVAWVLVGAAVFTWTDWRQTKHLCLLLPPLSLLIAALLAAAVKPGRIALRAGLVGAIAWNVSWLVRLARDFDSFPMSTVW